LTTDVPDAVERFRSVLYAQGGDDIYGVIRMSVLREVAPFGSYHWADRTFVAELALHGPFHNVPDFLYFRRDHPMRAPRTAAGIRRRCAHLDPRRANRWRNPAVRLVAEYLLAYVAAIWRVPLSTTDRWRSGKELAAWVARHADPTRRRRQLQESPDPADQALGTGSSGTPLSITVGTSVGRVASRRQQEGKDP
jgi:hypothetical protein